MVTAGRVAASRADSEDAFVSCERLTSSLQRVNYGLNVWARPDLILQISAKPRRVSPLTAISDRAGNQFRGTEPRTAQARACRVNG